MIVSILGRETRLAIAEIESIVGADSLRPFGPNAALIDADSAPILAGSPKVGEVIEEMGAAPWELQKQHLNMAVMSYARTLPIGKVTLGMSVYGAEIKPKQIQEFLLNIKKQLKAEGRSVRIVPNKEITLNAASVIHNKLAGRRSAELLFIQFGTRAILGKTTRVQDIDSYAKRDREKPVRDAVVGMLPPKLAQLMISLAVHQKTYQTGWILDPFCGSGTVLMEANVMGCKSYGTDVSEKMVDASTKNTEWLSSLGLAHGENAVELGDATSHTWKLKSPISAVVAEGYLGPPMTKLPPTAELSKAKAEVNTMTKKFLKNIHGQIKTGTPLVLALPAWHKKKEVIHLPLVDELEKLGYTRQDFEHVRGSLIYHRDKQVVGREILVLVRN